MNLSLGTGVAGQRRRGGGPRPPVPIRAPALGGSGTIGTAVAVDPGEWSGAAELALQWRLDGADLAGATAAAFVPGPAHDGGALSCRVVARNPAGSAAAATPGLRISQAAPALAAPLPDLRFIQASGTQTLQISQNFSGETLSFGITGEGVAIDPVTGELTISTEALRAGVAITVTVTNSGGSASGSFRLTVVAEPLAGPALVAPPALAGTGVIGTAVTLDPGSWSGEPALAVAWCRDGAPIADAAGTTYTPVAADDRTALTARVTATNPDGSAVAETAALGIVHAAPTVVGTLADRSFEPGAVATVEAAPAFAGAALRFAVEGAGASVDPHSGVISVPTDAALADAPVTVTATNSGGAAQAGFRVGVAAAPPAFPPAIPAGLWSAAEVRDAAPAGRRRIAIDAGVVVPAGFELRLYSGTVAGGQAELYNRVMTPGETFVTSGSMEIGETCHNLLYWLRLADGAWAAASAAAISFQIRGLEPVLLPPVAIAAPALAGTGLVGAPVTLQPGSWGGEPAPALAVAWLRDGAPIAGATGTVYTPTPADDRAALVARVTASNLAGSRVAETPALRVAYAAPEAAGELFDEIFDEDSGPQAVPTASGFVGEALSFSVDGAGATIDPATGVVTIPTDTPVSGELVTVTAANSGGSAESAFQVTVEAAELPGEEEPETPPVPPSGPLARTTMQSAVSKDGVSFAFAAPRPVGQYCNGDYFVVGPVTITAIAPASKLVSTAGYTAPNGWKATTAGGRRAVNGAELNPVPGKTQGFDAYVRAIGVGGPVYDAAKNVDPAVAGRLTVSAGSVVKAISAEGDPLTATPSGRSSVMRYVVLTVVPQIPVEGAFRPPVRGSDKRSYWSERDIGYGKLKRLAPISGMPGIAALSAATSAHFMTWQSYHNDGQQAAQSRQYPPYGRNLGWLFGDCLLRLHCNHADAEKRPLAINICQIGIDLVGHVKAGGAYPGEGSTMTGRKGVAVFAAALLDDPAMKTAVSWTRRRISFADDSQIFTVAPAHVNPIELAPASTARRARRVFYKDEDVGFPEWVTPSPEIRLTGLNAAIQSTYRPIWATGVLPNVLAVHLLEGGVAVWDCAPAFDYFDRIVRVFQGDPERWDFSETGKWLYEWQHNPLRHMAAWSAWRPLSGRRVWAYRPERPHPPALAVSGRTINGTFDGYQSDNGSPVTRRDVRYRRVGESAWTEVRGVGGSFALPNLAARTAHEVQVRLVNAVGAGPWSVNSPLDAGAAHNGNFRARIVTG